MTGLIILVIIIVIALLFLTSCIKIVHRQRHWLSNVLEHIRQHGV